MSTPSLNKQFSLSNAHLGLLYALGSAILFAIRPIFVKLVYVEGVDSLTLITLRMVFSLPIYVALLIYFMRIGQIRENNLLKPKDSCALDLKIILQIGLVGLLGYYAASYLDLLGLQYVSAQLGRLILYSYPTFVVFLGGLFFSQSINVKMLWSLLLTYLGVALIFTHDLQFLGSDVILGSMFILGSALFFSLYLLFCKPLIERVGSRIFTSIALIAASLAVFVHFAINHFVLSPQQSFIPDVSNRALVLTLIIAIFCTVIPTYLTTAAVSRIGADRTGVVATIGPAFTSVFAVLMLSEAFTVYHVIGTLLTVAGIWYLQKK